MEKGERITGPREKGEGYKANFDISHTGSVQLEIGGFRK